MTPHLARDLPSGGDDCCRLRLQGAETKVKSSAWSKRKRGTQTPNSERFPGASTLSESGPASWGCVTCYGGTRGGGEPALISKHLSKDKLPFTPENLLALNMKVLLKDRLGKRVQRDGLRSREARAAPRTESNIILQLENVGFPPPSLFTHLLLQIIQHLICPNFPSLYLCS